MIEKDSDFRPVMTGRQTLAWQALQNPDIEELMYGGASDGSEIVQ